MYCWKADASDWVVKKNLGAALDYVRGGKSQNSPEQKQDSDTISKYMIDVTEKAEAGGLDPVIGRDDEIRRCIQILQRRTKNNPVLIGEPGVGKTAIVEGLAQRIHNLEVPEGAKRQESVGARPCCFVSRS